ncbi:hypothetical protein Glove_17g45 [Diversispora epigaea]|uniref:SWIM-type domain-containing protein n=1 Tax=Diversispora epigaea TaxID=1348612 RepID=A0A397JLJ8_9GLOM|nr:hypothetical protein Glove_17g45 [Diversispora epigaea]
MNKSLGKRKAAENNDCSSTIKRKRFELRTVRFRHATKHDPNRIRRAKTEFMYLIGYEVINPRLRKYSVLGPTGYVHTIAISKTVSCSCPDFHLGFQCKHIYFVFLKVLMVDQNNKLIYQKELLINELKSIFDDSPPVTLQPNDGEIKKLKSIAAIKRRPIDGDCPVCREPLNNNERLIWCQSGCGNNIHHNCFMEWKKRKNTCVCCRTEWKDKM